VLNSIIDLSYRHGIKFNTTDEIIPCMLQPELTDVQFRKIWPGLIHKIHPVEFPTYDDIPSVKDYVAGPVYPMDSYF